MLVRNVAKYVPVLRRAYFRRTFSRGLRSQSNEGEILRSLSGSLGAPATFVEFGFSPSEFNCAALMSDHQGLLIDGDRNNVEDARHIFPSNIRAEHLFLTVDNLDIIREAFSELGILSIDVDGNDYWFLENLIDLRPP